MIASFRKMLLAAVLVAFALSTGRAADEGKIVDLAIETATHEEVEPLDVEFGSLSALRLDACGRLLAGDAEAKEIKVISSRGRQVGSIKLGFAPEAIDVAPNGTIYCGGEGQLAVLDRYGRVVRTVTVPDEAASNITSRRRARSRPLRISGIAVSPSDVFVAFGSGWSLGSKSRLFRFDRDLGNPRLLAEGLRGCCQRCDIVTLDGLAYLAENSAHRVVSYNHDGEILGKWGARSRTDVEGFGACCNPMNLCFDANGVLYTAESGLGRVKRYSTDGEYLGLVGYVGVERFTNAGRLAASCSNIAIAVTPDGSRVYVMDYSNKLVRVLQKKKEKDDCPTVRPRARILGRHHGVRRAKRRR
jgi:DNA-binding beta-propeller fold protein YncE